MIETVSDSANLNFLQKIHLMLTDGLWHRHIGRVPIEFRVGKYVVRTIDTFEEYWDVMELRHIVFQKEFSKKRFSIWSDRDTYDRDADFLVVKDVFSKRIVGCYRLICSRFTKRFSSAATFNIDQLMAAPGAKVELCRACILPSHRNGQVINLLWRGIIRYLISVEGRYFFGCGSIPSTDPILIGEAMKEFRRRGMYSDTLRFPVHKKFQMRTPVESENTNSSKIEIPHLLRSYFNAGARICSGPAVDPKFRCTDFLVVIDFNDANTHFWQRYATR